MIHYSECDTHFQELISNSRCFMYTCHVQNFELLTCASLYVAKTYDVLSLPGPMPGHGQDPGRLCVERQRHHAEYQLSGY